MNLERAVKLREANDDAKSPWLAEAEIALVDCLIDQAQAIQAAHADLGEQFKTALASVAARLAAL